MELKDHIGVRRAAQRKLEHELGISPKEIPLDDLRFMTRIHYKAQSDPTWGEHEIDYIFIIKRDVSVNPNPNEVKSYRYITKEELTEFLAGAEANGISVTPWFKLIVQNFLYKWWDQLDALGDDEKATLYRM
eukprot:m.227805 g.227805  ORF g.227805 m.227805 type:complete len:132 (-) comp54245_c0_seq8:164-559(-)